MRNLKAIKEDVEFVGSLKGLTESYEEIAVIQMQKARDSVLRTRIYLDGVSGVFADVKRSFKQSQQAQEEVAKFTTFTKNGKSVNVLLSANNKLYGSIITKVFDLFISNLKSTDETIIIGKLGRDLMEQREPEIKYKYFEVPDRETTAEDLKPLLADLLKYEKVIVFYGKFVNVINQEAVSSSVSGDQPGQETPTDKPTEKIFFEPDLGKVYTFFEEQIFALLLKQTMHEAHLARLASRIQSMEAAVGNIEKEQDQLLKEERRIERVVSGKKQTEVYSGISLWGGSTYGK